jgi:hypothetical protein
MFNKEDYEKKLDFDKSHKLCKVFLKKDKNGKSYFIGDMNNSNVLYIQKNKYEGSTEGEYIVKIVPISYTKKKMDGIIDKRNQPEVPF